MTFDCGYCKKKFAKETSIAVHMCEPKRRRLNRDERGVQLGFQAWLKFYEHAQGSAKLKTFEDFCDSAYYRAFVKFGHYCVNTHVINPVQYMIWLLKHNKKIDKWASDQLYTEYLVWYLAVESAADALARAIEHSVDWEQHNQTPSRDMLRYGNHNALCHDIVTGRISAWVIYNCQSGQALLTNLNSEQISMIWPYVNSDVWQKCFQDYAADRAWVENMLNKAGW